MQQLISNVADASVRRRWQPAVSGSKTKYCQFKLRVVLPWDDHTAAVHAAGTGSALQRTLLNELEGQLQLQRVNVVLVSLTVDKPQSKVFKRAGDVPCLVALLQVSVAYSASHGMCTKDFLDHAQVSLNDGRYSANALESAVVRD
jgi:hypothetical protein